jgi:hypothetical protein
MGPGTSATARVPRRWRRASSYSGTSLTRRGLSDRGGGQRRSKITHTAVLTPGNDVAEALEWRRDEGEPLPAAGAETN